MTSAEESVSVIMGGAVGGKAGEKGRSTRDNGGAAGFAQCPLHERMRPSPVEDYRLFRPSLQGIEAGFHFRDHPASDDARGDEVAALGDGEPGEQRRWVVAVPQHTGGVGEEQAMVT